MSLHTDAPVESAIGRLDAELARLDQVAIAVSGGIDSLTLATAAQRRLGAQRRVTMHHAISPAVPPEATARTRALAHQQGWSLDIFDAGEFDDPAYRANPVNRCFFCKTSLYGAVARRTSKPILSGTNLDDLGEYRPGLQAAEQHGVRHPFVAAGIDKSTVRLIAHALGLGDLSELPSAPCLSSRIQTGIPIDPATLVIVHAVENHIRAARSPQTVRCRIRPGQMVIELDQAAFAALDLPAQQGLTAEIAGLGGTLPVFFAPYRNGSAFIRPLAHASAA